jgi:hypothetical protein
LNQLPKQIREEVTGLLLVLPLEIAIKVCNADALVILKASSKLVDHNQSEYRLSGSRNTWAKECLLVGL